MVTNEERKQLIGWIIDRTRGPLVDDDTEFVRVTVTLGKRGSDGTLTYTHEGFAIADDLPTVEAAAGIHEGATP